MAERLTRDDIDKVSFSPWELCGLDDVCGRDCFEPSPCKIPKIIRKLFAYENLGTVEELAELVKAKRDGRCVVLPCKVGDNMFSFRWSIKNQKYEVCTGKIKNVRYDTVDDLVTVSDGERYCVWGKTAFPTPEEAEAALAKETTMNEIEATISTFERHHELDEQNRVIILSALREKAERENPQPLTLDELREMCNEPVWIRDLLIEKCSRWHLISKNAQLGLIAIDSQCEKLKTI